MANSEAWGISMQLNEETCPVPESVIGGLYQAKPEGLEALIQSISPKTRAALAVYCYRRGHLASIGLVIASTCGEQALVWEGGNLGADLFEKSRSPGIAFDADVARGQKRKISLHPVG
jgi:hypothetical protein